MDYKCTSIDMMQLPANSFPTIQFMVKYAFKTIKINKIAVAKYFYQLSF